MVLSSCSYFKSVEPKTVEELIITPDSKGHLKIEVAIAKAKKSLWMKMFHLTDPEIINALIAAEKRKVDVKILLDSKSLVEPKFKKAYDQLLSAGVNVRASSSCFSLTHEKSLIVDGIKAFITSMNLTRNFDQTRDFGVKTSDENIIHEMSEVFKTDWQNALDNTCKTPALTVKNLIWSPVNSEERLSGFIHSASDSILLTVENLGNKKIEDALIEMASQGTKIRLIVPQCDKNINPLFNYPFINKLILGNIDVRVMPDPSSKEHPYMHSKMILVDQKSAYIGSINFSNNSLLRSRELGILFNDADAVQKVEQEFERDWKVSVIPVPLKQGFCPPLE
jgi:cardiolipin synthase